jgi:hypothetical protein
MQPIPVPPNILFVYSIMIKIVTFDFVSDEMKEKLIGTSDDDEECDEDECEDENSNEIPE